MSSDRSLVEPIRDDLTTKMVLLAGPRQVGKTTLGEQMLDADSSGAYFNWDNRDDRRDIRAAHWPGGGGLVVLDELHKWRGWKRWLKGEFDKHRRTTRFLVTGSARMDVFRHGGDSLQGRYHHYRLHPFSLAEMESARRRTIEPGAPLQIGRGDRSALDALLAFSGFPEPLLAGAVRTHRRWQKDRLDRVFREDVRDLEAVRDLAAIENLAEMLPSRVGSLLSLNALREDLEVSHRAVTHWIDVLDRLYHVFRVRPFEGRKVRSLRRMPKAYLWDWTLVPDPGARFENLVASHLLKFTHYLRDTDGHDVDLHYLRDRAGHEVDFLVTHGGRPWFAVEVKLADTNIDPAIHYFQQRLKIPFVFQVVRDGTRDFVEGTVRCLPAEQFLTALC